MTLENEEIVRWLESLDKESKALKKELFSICWYMRGSISYDDAVMLNFEERQMIGKLIKDNLEITKDSGLPFF